MTEPRFLQVHFLSSYPGALLNRDDAGLAKRLPFGSATRTRVSSQCLKRHWRMADDARAVHRLGQELGAESERSKVAIERLVAGPLRDGTNDEIVDAVQGEFVKAIYGKKALDPKARQALLLGRPEIDWLGEQAARLVADAGDAKAAAAAAVDFFKEEKSNLKALLETNALAPGLESALFGRMVTSDPRANRDAALHVAHAFTVHDEQPELDYFTVVDDLTGRSEENEDGGTGAAGVFDTELTSGLYYGYVVVDMPLLVSNLSGVSRSKWAANDADRSIAARVVENLLYLVATVTPGAKKGSTAPYSYADLVLVEAGSRQPRTLANAFREPVPLRGDGTLVERAYAALDREIEAIDAMFGTHETRYVAARGDGSPGSAEKLPLTDLAARVGEIVTAASI